MNQINPDQILTSEEIKSAKDAFEEYDKIGYGILEVEELQKILEEFGHIINYQIRFQDDNQY
ncbi:unnamed protein product [Paramecium pentaurelia]|uniref:EF-hand domain-containing protein n=1 Tax=Paramecium pentaurelia TaxID=43138 RepID=A0A8S1VYG6_9CILI|nr:unnamed protein product [Paramecium pentaurelia]